MKISAVERNGKEPRHAPNVGKALIILRPRLSVKWEESIHSRTSSTMDGEECISQAHYDKSNIKRENGKTRLGK